MSKRRVTVPVTKRALVQRINRRLAEGQRLRADRGGGEVRYLVIDIKRDAIVETDVDLDKLARKLGVLRPWELVTP